MTRDEVLRDFLGRFVAPATEAERAMADRIAELTDTIAAVEAERDAMESMYRHHVAVALDAIAKLNHAQAILAALREPSDMVVDALREYVLDLSRFDDALKAIHLAVTAAEQEVGDEPR